MSSAIIITPAAVSKLAGSAPHLLNRCSRVLPHVLCHAPHRLARSYKVTLMEHANFVWLEHADDSAQLTTAMEQHEVLSLPVMWVDQLVSHTNDERI